MELPVHPLARLLPPLSDSETRELTASVRAHGQLEPARTWQDDEGTTWLLDGRHRAVACHALNLELRVEPFFGDEAAARSLVLALNVHRRHLSPAQRAISVAALATYERGQRRDTGARAGLTQSEAADLAGVSERAVRSARVVLRKAESETVEAVIRGDVSLRAAEKMTRAQRSAAFHAVRRETQSDAWLSPPWILERAESLLRGIDLDVASGPERNVPARRHFVLDEGVDALSQESWANADGSPSTAWMNSPFSGTGPGVWTRRMVAEYESGNVSRAILLVPARVGADWLRAMGRFPRVELPRSAVSFAPGVGNPMHGQAVGPSPFAVILIGVGVDARAMHDAFGDVGDVVVRYEPSPR